MPLSIRPSHRPLVGSLLLLLAGLCLGVPSRARATGETPSRASVGEVSKTGPVQVIIELERPTALDAYLRERTEAQAARRAHPEEIARRAAKLELTRIDQDQALLVRTLESPAFGAKVIFRTQRVANAVAVDLDAARIEALRGLPGVKRIQPLRRYERDNTTSVPFIGTVAAWARESALTGKDLKIGIIDTGIDYLHTDFGGPGTGYRENDITRVGDAPGFPGTKVAGGFDFAGDEYNASDANRRTPRPDPDPMDCNGHGTHVAGTAAGQGVNANGSTFSGPYDADTPFSQLRIGPGVAPEARLFALKVFGCTGSTALVVPAIEWAVDPNQDGDFSDRLDVINLSLGSSFGSPDDVDDRALDRAAQAGVICVASAGNAGDIHFITGSPASSARTISVASSVDDGLTRAAVRIEGVPELTGNLVVGSAQFGTALTRNGLVGDVALAEPALSCGPLTNAAVIRGKIAVIDRGDCGFAAKVKNAQDAGAIGAIVVNNVPGAPINMAADPAVTGITIPAVMVSQPDGNRIKAQAPGGLKATLAIVTQPELGDTVSGFSSRGPSLGNFLKPDIAAPGSSIPSARTGSGNGGTVLSGTSMAAPHIAGAMALLRQANPTWTVEELKALAMNTATQDLFVGLNQTGTKYGLGRIGAGRVNLKNAAASSVIALTDDDSGRVSVSFGALDIAAPTTLTRAIRVVNKGATEAAYTVGYQSIVDMPGVEYSFPDGDTVTVAAGASATIRIALTADPAAMRNTSDASLLAVQSGRPRYGLNESAGYVVLTPVAEGTRLRVPVHAVPRPVSTLTAQGDVALSEATGTVRLELGGRGFAPGTTRTDVVSLVTPLELQEISPDDPSSGGDANEADLRFVGIAGDIRAKGGKIADSVVYFGIATHANWHTPHSVGISILIDSNNDGRDDFRVTNSNAGVFVPAGSAASTTDAFMVRVVNLANNLTLTPRFFLNGLSPDGMASPVFNTNVMVLPVAASEIGLTDANAKFSYRVETTSFFAANRVDASQRLTYDAARPGLSFGGNSILPALSVFTGGELQIGYSRDDFTNAKSRGIVLFHHQNAFANRAQAIPLGGN